MNQQQVANRVGGQIVSGQKAANGDPTLSGFALATVLELIGPIMCLLLNQAAYLL